MTESRRTILTSAAIGAAIGAAWMAWLLWSLGGLPDRPEGVRFMLTVVIGFIAGMGLLGVAAGIVLCWYRARRAGVAEPET